MPKTRAQRRRSAARRPAEPTSPSPPQTPTTISPTAGRKAPPSSRMAAKHSPIALRKSSAPKNLRPLGGGKFSYSRSLRPEDLSPASSEEDEDDDMSRNKFDVLRAGLDESDDAEDEEDSDDDINESDGNDDDSSSSESDSDDEDENDSVNDDDVYGLPIPPSPPAPPAPHRLSPPYMEFSRVTTTITIAVDHLIIEDLGEYESDSDDGEVSRPYAIEFPAESEPILKQPPRRRELDPHLQRNFADLNPFDTSDDDMDETDEFEVNRRKERELRRLRRMKSGSISKRTISERGSDSDREDVGSFCLGDLNDSASVYRRTRRKTDRHSMQFSGQFQRIEELKEPNSDDEIIFEDAEILARELPFWTFMDVDSE